MDTVRYSHYTADTLVKNSFTSTASIRKYLSFLRRNWSVYGIIRGERRSHMRHEVGDKLVYCHEAIALHNKLSDAGFKIDSVPWDEDSDSDSDQSD